MKTREDEEEKQRRGRRGGMPASTVSIGKQKGKLLHARQTDVQTIQDIERERERC